ncbi:MAG: recombination protein RecR [Spirochaetes bacterium]|nr:MAG: recombination protein RecR [Spirochaetota bacterium]RKX84570.1 MAG: recombination protein RecR [Spirochaetota bacterium]RKX98587.1 MAG: recombination protein RecR [Spirochaetota bacterium]
MERLDRLITYFSRLPGIGRKSASRIAYWLLETDRGFVEGFSKDLGEIRDCIVRCRECGNYAESELCDVCDSPVRERSLMCVVEQSRDVATIESTGEFRGIYHVLHGVLSPLDGVGPEELGLGKMRARIKKEGVSEVIVATNPTLEGDSTALYIVRMLSEDGIKVSRIATGLPVGGDMEYADKLSVARALRARQNL